MNKSKSNHPLLTLGESDKFYLALSQVDDVTFSYILALLLKQNKSGQIIMVPRIEVMTFANKERATIYYNTLEQIMLLQHSRLPHIAQGFEKEVANFLENTR